MLDDALHHAINEHMERGNESHGAYRTPEFALRRIKARLRMLESAVHNYNNKNHTPNTIRRALQLAAMAARMAQEFAAPADSYPPPSTLTPSPDASSSSTPPAPTAGAGTNAPTAATPPPT